MVHKKEWYTCDRCGEEIKENIYARKFPAQNLIHRIKLPEKIHIESDVPYIYIRNIIEKDLKFPEITSVEVTRGYEGKHEEIHLCGKCVKAFEKFMKME